MPSDLLPAALPPDEPARYQPRFESRKHAGALSPAMLLTRESASPIAVLLLPLMVVGMTQSLQGGQIPPLLWILVGLVAALSPLIALFRLQTRIVEIVVSPPLVGARSAWQVARGVPMPFSSIGNLRTDAQGLYFSWSQQALELDAYDWRDPLALRDALAEAQRA